MTVVLVLTSVVIMLSILLNKISERVGMPVLLAFILLGMLFGERSVLPRKSDARRASPKGSQKIPNIICLQNNPANSRRLKDRK